METQTQPQTEAPSIWQRSTTRRFFAWLFARQTLRRLAFAAAVLVTLVATFYSVENWRGKHAWLKFKHQMEAQGEHLDWAAFIPPALPDDKNFAATPFLHLIAVERGNSPTVEKFWPKDFNNASGLINTVRKTKKAVPGERKLIDLAAWEAAFVKAKTGKGEALPEVVDTDPAVRAKAAAVVLENLKGYDPVLNELRQASSRPGCRFDIRYNEENPFAILLSHLARIKGISNVLQLRAAAELALGQTDQAYQDVRLMLRLVDAFNDEPILISYLVRVAMFRITTDLIWEGLAQRQWTDAHLQEFQGRLQQFDFLAGLEKTFRAERAVGIKLCEYIRNRTNRGRAFQELGSEDQTASEGDVGWVCLFNLMPTGWLYWEEYNYAHSFPMPVTTQARRVEPSVCRARDQALEKILSGNRRVLEHRMISGLLLPALGRVQARAAEIQTIADEAVLACALERYRRANGQFPEQLQSLSPRFMEKVPDDIITGKPLIYRRAEDGQYLLYSVGWNEKDDGGVVALRQLPAFAQSATNAHDWVWRSQAKR